MSHQNVNPAKPEVGQDQTSIGALTVTQSRRTPVGGVESEPALQVAAALRDLRRTMSAADLRSRVYGSDVDLRVVDTLDVLSEHVQLRVGEFASELRVEQSTATRAVDRLEDLGLAIRTESDDDGRGILVSLTQAGDDQHAEFRKRRLELFESLLTSFTPAEIQLLVEFLERLTKAIDGVRADSTQVGRKGD